MNLDRLSRITDLFQEGRELHFGDDPDGKPILVWVNKLNSFEDEEARRDGSAARSLRLLMLDGENPEIKNAREELADFDKDDLVQVIAAQSFDEDYLLAIDDVDSDPDMKDDIAALRMMSLLEDSKVPEDDERREAISELNAKYVKAVQDGTTKRQDDRRRDLTQQSAVDLQDQFIKNWKNRVGMADFLAEQRVTQIFYALRDCQATAKPDDKGWDHSKCKHTRLLSERSQVRELPENVLERTVQMIVDMTVERREAGNSDVPTNSSESSEQPKQEEASIPSTPAETPVVVQQT